MSKLTKKEQELADNLRPARITASENYQHLVAQELKHYKLDNIELTQIVAKLAILGIITLVLYYSTKQIFNFQI
jgi:hypothetical protein